MEWYDDRVHNVVIHAREPTREAANYRTPRDIYNYLDERIWKNEEAKRAASLIMWKCLHRIRTNSLFVGPTGSGKTAVWLALQELFCDRIFVADASSITQDGWKGSTKFSDILRPVTGLMKNTIIVMDEIDKMIAPKFSYNENVSHSIQSEALKMLEGNMMYLKDGKDQTFCVDTRKISFVLCGAFSTLANDIATKNRPASIGFNSSQAKPQPYSKKLTMQDVISFGMISEMAGRLDGQIVNTELLGVEDYTRMLTESRHSPIQRLEDTYGIKLHLSQQKKLEIAQNAFESGLGVREITNQLTKIVDDTLFDEPDTNYIEIF